MMILEDHLYGSVKYDSIFVLITCLTIQYLGCNRSSQSRVSQFPCTTDPQPGHLNHSITDYSETLLMNKPICFIETFWTNSLIYYLLQDFNTWI